MNMSRRLRIQHRISSPLYLDAITNLHHPEFRKAVPPKTQVIVYHGTSSVALASMLQQGTISYDVSRTNYDNTSPGVFVTKNFGFFSAEMYGNKAAQTQGGDEVVLELQIPLGWIDQDPDDTQVDAQGEMNDYGKKQGIVRNPISVKRIRQLKIHSDALAPVFSQDSKTQVPDVMGYWTPWTPVGVVLDKLTKATKKGIELPPEYLAMVGARPRGMSRSPAPETQEQKLAELLESFYSSMMSLDYDSEISHYDKTLWFVHNRKFSGWMQAIKAIPDYLVTLGGVEAWDTYRESYQNSDYWPKTGESLIHFLKRV